MPYHWGDPFQINQVTAKATSPPVTAVPGPQELARLIGKKPSKLELKTLPPKEFPKGVVAFELIFRSRVTGEELTVRVPALGAFHDPERRTTLTDVKKLGVEIANALNRVFHTGGEKGGD